MKSFLLFFLFISVLAGKSQNQIQVMRLNDSIIKLGDILLNRKQKSLEFQAKVNKTDALIEVLACMPRGKLHENLFTTTVSPVELQTALILLGYTPIREQDNPDPALADSFSILVLWEKDARQYCVPVEELIMDNRTRQACHRVNWSFQGLYRNRDGPYLVNDGVSVIVTYSDLLAVMVLKDPDARDDTLFYAFTKNHNLEHDDMVTLRIIPPLLYSKSTVK